MSQQDEQPQRHDRRGAEPRSHGRRRFLGWMAASGAVGAAAGSGATAGLSETRRASGAETPRASGAAITARGDHQAGIEEVPPAAVRLVGMDLRPDLGDPRPAVRQSLRGVQQVITSMGRAEPQARDSGQATAGLYPGSATINVGFGPGLLAALGVDQPEEMAPVPAFPTDRLDPAAGEGDLLLACCAEEAVTASSLARNVLAAAQPGFLPRWIYQGFRPSEASRRGGAHQPRNLMGQIDGTNNPELGSSLFDTTVWVPEWAGPPWMAGGSYLVLRKIRMLLDQWYAEGARHREAVIGRGLAGGEPLSGGPIDARPNLAATADDGSPAIASDAHIRLASSETTGGARIFRRPFNYDNGLLADGTRDSGLLFLAFQADTRRGFIPIMDNLAGQGAAGHGDALNEYTVHEASALFAVPPAPGRGGYVGRSLLEG